MTILVDSSVWIDFFRGDETRQTATLLRFLEGEWSSEPEPPEILVGDLVLCEVLRGVSDDAAYEQVKHYLSAFSNVTLATPRIAISSADHIRALRKLGITIRNTIDCLIAAWCIEHRIALLHNDRDFVPFQDFRGLKVV
ncbi:MAG: PIN domain nuclease [Geminicoccaceae bacterium]